MAGGYHIYYEAAEALWDMPNRRLEDMAREDGSPANRRAAMATLRLKAEFVSPEAFGNERSSITKLAGVLNDDPGFTMEMALKTGTPARKKSSKVLVQAGVVRPSGLSRTMWLAITAGVILLLMDVLATAGVPVPTPIGAIIDGLSGDDESPSSPPAPVPSRTRGKRDRSSILGDGGEPIALPRYQPRASNHRKDDPRRAPGKTSPPFGGDSQKSGDGRELHQAQGRELHQAQGRAEHQPDNPGNASTKSPPRRGPHPRSNGVGPSGE